MGKQNGGLLVVVEKTIQVISTDTLKAENAVRIDDATDLYDAFGVYNKNPYEDAGAIRIDHTLIDGYLVLPRSTTATSYLLLDQKYQRMTTEKVISQGRAEQIFRHSWSGHY